MASLSSLLHVCYLENGISQRLNARVFKLLGHPESKILYFCNYAGESINMECGWELYRSITTTPRTLRDIHEANEKNNSDF